MYSIIILRSDKYVVYENNKNVLVLCKKIIYAVNCLYLIKLFFMTALLITLITINVLLLGGRLLGLFNFIER
jgi:hypothetical protein